MTTYLQTRRLLLTCFWLMLWLLGTAQTSLAQVYYALSDASSTTLDQLRRAPLAGGSETTVVGSNTVNFPTNPGAMAYDAANNRLLILNNLNNAPYISAVNLSTNAVTTLVTPAAISGATSTTFSGAGLAIANGNVYYALSDASSTTLDQLRSYPLAGGSETTVVGSSTVNFPTNPGAMAYDAANNRLLILNNLNNAPYISAVNLSTNAVTTLVTPAAISGATSTTFSGAGLAIANGNVYYALSDASSTTLDQLRSYPLAGGSETTVVGSSTVNFPTNPGAMAYDAANNRLLILNNLNNAPYISAVNLSTNAVTTLVTPAAISGATNTTFSGAGLAVVQASTTVASIVPAAANPTNAASVTFTVTFAASVSGLTVNNFITAPGTGISGSSVTSVSGSGTTYTVTVNTGTGSGTLGLTLQNDNGLTTSISNKPFTGTPLYTIDKTAPTVTVSSTAGASGSSTGTSPIPFTVTFSESVTGFVAGDVTVGNGAITGGSFSGSGTTYAFTVTPTTPGTATTVSVPANVAQDAAGNGNTAATQFTITYIQPQTTAPVVQVPALGSAIANTTPAYSGTAPANSTVTVYVDGSSIGTTTANAAGSWLLTQPTALAQGSHTVYATAQLSGQAVSANSNTNNFTVDTTAPNTTITANPTNPSNSSSATFTFTGNDGSGSGVASFQAQLDGGGFATATSPRTYTGLADGSHTFQVRAVDAAGNVDPTPASYTWTIDTTPPPAPVTITPANGSLVNTATPTYTGTAEANSTVTVLVDATSIGTTTANAAGNWSLPQPTALAQGSHTVRARATDAAGNTSVDSNTNTFTVDTTPPAAPVVTAPANGSFVNTTTPTYTGTAEANSTVTVVVDATSIGTTTANAAGNWSLPQPTALAQGSHTVRALATDAAGNPSPLSNTNTFTVDTTAPTVVISSSAGASGSSTSTSPIPFTVTFSESVTGFVVGDITATNGTVGSFSGSGSTYTFTVTPAGNGPVTVNVAAGVAQDAAGNGNTAATQFTITYNLPTATVTAVTGQTPSPTATSTVTYRVTFSTAVAGLTATNFSLTTSGLSGASVASVSGSGTTYAVVVNTGTGDGTLRLNVASSSGVTPTISNVPYTSGTTYTITKSFAAAPQLTIQGLGGTGSDVTAFVDIVQVLSGGSPVANALQNGSFETHGPLSNGDYGYNPTGASWTFNSGSGIAEAGSAFTPVTPIPNGIAVGVVQNTGLLQQNLALPTGSNYQVNFQAAQRVCCSSQDQTLNMFLNGVFIGSIQPGTSAYSGFTSATFAVTAPSLTATVNTTSGSPTSTSPIPFSVSFSQSVGSTFTASDVTVTGGTLNAASFGGSGAGPYTFTVTPTGVGIVTVSLAAGVATDVNNTGNSASNAVSVQFQAPTITVSPVSLAGGTQGTLYSQTITASGGTGTYTFAVTFGALPAGLTLASNGALSGTPTANGTFNFTVTATDNSVAPGPYSGSRAYTLTIAAPAVTDLTISTGSAASPVDVAAGTYNNVTVTGTGFARLNGAVIVNSSFTVQTGGALNTNCQSLTGSGSFTLQDGATLYICNTGGIASTGSTGAIQLSGARSFSPNADYVYNGSGAQVTGTGLPSQVRNLTSTNTATLTLTQPVAIRQVLTLNAGILNTNSQALTLLSDASGTALIANLGAGSVSGAVTVQRYIDPTLNPGLGYRHLSAPVAGATVGSFGSGGATLVVNNAYNTAADPGTVVPFPTVYFYDQARLATSPATTLSAFDKGWTSPTSLTNTAQLAFQGFTVQLPGASTLSFSGQVGNGGGSIPLSRNSGATAADAGWNLVGNPYPAPLDFSSIPAGQRVNMDAAFYTFESTSQYGGNYRSYVNGIGGNPLVGTAQAFFVRVSAGQTSGSLSLNNTNRVTTYGQQAPVRRTTADSRPLVQLALKGAGSTLADNVFVYFEQGSTDGFDTQYDAVKLPNSSGLNLSTSIPGQQLSIDGRPVLGTTQRVVPLAVGVPAAGSYLLNAAQLRNLSTTPVYLRDLQTGAVVDLAQQPSYSFVVSNATALITGRFELVFSPQGALATAPAALAAQVGLYPNPATAVAFVELPAALGRVAVAAELVDALGRTVRTQQLPAQGAVAHRLDLGGLATGLYTLHLRTSAGVVVKKLVVE